MKIATKGKARLDTEPIAEKKKERSGKSCRNTHNIVQS